MVGKQLCGKGLRVPGGWLSRTSASIMPSAMQTEHPGLRQQEHGQEIEQSGCPLLDC